ncbi:hypothetical protein HK405_011775, partial [Cladochytrium tenue]
AYDSEKLLALKNENEASWRQSDSSDAYSERLYYWRRRWLEDAIRDVSGGPSRAASTPTKGLATLPKLRASLQGPFLIGPRDPEVEAAEGCDMCVSSIGALPVFFLSYAARRFHVCLETTPVEPLWDFTELAMPERAPPKLAIAECIDFAADRSEDVASAHATGAAGAKVAFYNVPLALDNVFVSVAGGMYAIDTSSWASKVAEKGEIPGDASSKVVCFLDLGHEARTGELASELSNQSAYISRLAETVEKTIIPRTKKLEAQAAVVEERQQKLARRCESLLQLALDVSQPELNKEELAFADELRDIGFRIKQKYAPQVTKLEREKAALVQRLERVRREARFGLAGTATASEGALSSMQVQEAAELLRNEL